MAQIQIKYKRRINTDENTDENTEDEANCSKIQNIWPVCIILIDTRILSG